MIGIGELSCPLQRGIPHVWCPLIRGKLLNRAHSLGHYIQMYEK